MEIFLHKELHWTLKISHIERREIFLIAHKLGKRPTDVIRSILEDGLNQYKKELL